mgnify:CR=1 FL=1
MFALLRIPSEFLIYILQLFLENCGVIEPWWALFVLGIFVCTTLFNESHKVFILTKMQQIIIMSVSQV